MKDEIDIGTRQKFSADIRIQTIKAIAVAGFGHIGGSASLADVLGVLYGGVMNIRPKQPDWPDRDWFVLSKGHCGPALYATLAIKGYFPLEKLATLNKPGTMLPSHCDRLKTPGVDMTTGSLGQGISAAVGIALGLRLKKKNSYVYCVIGDGESQEGQVWEAIETAVHQQLAHLIIFLDWNKKQLDGRLEDICNPRNFEEKFSSFGCFVQICKGYDVGDIYRAICTAKGQTQKPSLIILDTIKGIGVNFAEREDFNHYMVVNDAMAEEAVGEIERRISLGCYPEGDGK
jgi:transketolase